MVAGVPYAHTRNEIPRADLAGPNGAHARRGRVEAVGFFEADTRMDVIDCNGRFGLADKTVALVVVVLVVLEPVEEVAVATAAAVPVVVVVAHIAAATAAAADVRVGVMFVALADNGSSLAVPSGGVVAAAAAAAAAAIAIDGVVVAQAQAVVCLFDFPD